MTDDDSMRGRRSFRGRKDYKEEEEDDGGGHAGSGRLRERRLRVDQKVQEIRNTLQEERALKFAKKNGLAELFTELYCLFGGLESLTNRELSQNEVWDLLFIEYRELLR